MQIVDCINAQPPKPAQKVIFSIVAKLEMAKNNHLKIKKCLPFGHSNNVYLLTLTKAKVWAISRIAIIEEIASAPAILALNWWLPD